MRRVLLPLTFVLLAGSGCGSAATVESRLPTTGAAARESAEYGAAKGRFIGEEEAICRPAVARLSRWRARIGSLTHVPRARAARTAELIQEEITLEYADFARMEPPSEPSRDVPRISNWLRSLRFAAADAVEFAEALSTGDGESAEARAAYRKMANANARNRRFAAGYGFNYCSELQ
jgi:hypothetical protein